MKLHRLGYVPLLCAAGFIIYHWGPAEQTMLDAQAAIATPAPETTTSVAVGPPPTTPPTIAAATVSQPPERLGNATQATDTLPPPYQWEHPIPSYRPGGACNRDEATRIAQAMHARGADDATVTWMLGVVSRESNCDHTARNLNRNTRDDSFGLCQLNARSGHFGDNGLLAGWDRWHILESHDYSAAACAAMWAECGRGPWNYGNYYCSKP